MNRASAVSSALPKNTLPAGNRIESIDLLRGIVMIIMALDHVRDHFTATGLNPTNISEISTIVFMTRWITHFCAPVCVCRAGMDAFISGSRGKTNKPT